MQGKQKSCANVVGGANSRFPDANGPDRAGARTFLYAATHDVKFGARSDPHAAADKNVHASESVSCARDGQVLSPANAVFTIRRAELHEAREAHFAAIGPLTPHARPR